ncbi:MAG: efflux transporter outer membrane subunit [Paucibacter sp.]|nr:efflux transporter outer membrane subunit [Roseateles sp.]
MEKIGRHLYGLTVLLAVASVMVTLAGCASSDGIAPKARPADVQTLAPLTGAPIDLNDHWWEAYGDASLNALVERGLASNPNLAVTRLRVERAEALASLVDANRQPRVDGGLDATRERYSAHSALPPVLAGHVRTSASTLLSGSWELDVFGRQRAQLDAAIGGRRAAAADDQAARVLLASNIVRQYIQLARLDDQREVLERSLTQRQDIFTLIEQRVRAGLDTAVELNLGEGAIPEIRAAIEAVDEQRQLARHALALLSGQGPAALEQLSPRLAKVLLLATPEALPADLLGRRADITAARWRVEAASRELEAAHAQFYPSINLFAFAGFSAIGLDQLVEAGSRQIGVGPAVRLPIFDAGRLRANYRSKSTDVDSAVESYNAAVLEALHDAADAITSVSSAQRQLQERRLSLASAERAYELAVQRFRVGLGSYLSVLTAETNVLAQRSAETEQKARALDSQAMLARALGGGYVQPAAQIALQSN